MFKLYKEFIFISILRIKFSKSAPRKVTGKTSGRVNTLGPNSAMQEAPSQQVIPPLSQPDCAPLWGSPHNPSGCNTDTVAQSATTPPEQYRRHCPPEAGRAIPIHSTGKSPPSRTHFLRIRGPSETHIVHDRHYLKTPPM